MAENRQYDHEYKVQAVKPAKEIGQAKAAREPGCQRIPCMAGYGPAALAISAPGQVHRPRKAL